MAESSEENFTNDASSSQDGGVDDQDNNNSFINTSNDEILSPTTENDERMIVAEELFSEGDASFDFGEFQVLDECVEEDEPESQGNENSEQPPSQPTSSKSERKPQTTGKNVSNTIKSPVKKTSTTTSSTTMERKGGSSSGNRSSRKRDDSRSRSSRRQRGGRSRSRSRSYRRRSSSRSRRGDRRRSRSRSPRRTSRKKSPEKKNQTSTTPGKSIVAKKKEATADQKPTTTKASTPIKSSGTNVKPKKPIAKVQAAPSSKKNNPKATAGAPSRPEEASTSTYVKILDETTEGSEIANNSTSDQNGQDKQESSATQSDSSAIGAGVVEESTAQAINDDVAPKDVGNASMDNNDDTPLDESKLVLSNVDSSVCDYSDYLEITVADDEPMSSVLGSSKTIIKNDSLLATKPKNGTQQPTQPKVFKSSTHQRKTSETKPVIKKHSGGDSKKPEGDRRSRNSSARSGSNRLSGSSRSPTKPVQSTKPPPSKSPQKSTSSSTAMGIKKRWLKRVEASNNEGKKNQTEAPVEVKHSKELLQPKASDTNTERGAVNASPLIPRRKEPVAEVKVYVDSIRNLEFDSKVYCSFYCVACPLLLPTTPRYEDHLNMPEHKKNVVRWRICQDLIAEKLNSNANRQLDVDNFAETIVGADQVIEICDSASKPCNFVCILCSSFHSDIDALLGHLTSFLHIENYMETRNNDVFTPPDISVAEFESLSVVKRQSDSDHVSKVFSEATGHMMRHGRGCMRSYVGDKYHDMNCSIVTEMEEMEETVMNSLMEQLFEADGSYKIKWSRVDINKSVGNRTYQRQTQETRDKIVGLQTVIEIWFPNRRMPPVYYCTVCNYTVTGVIAHCMTNKHYLEYFDKFYKSISESLILEADDADSMKDSLVTAVKFVLTSEGRTGRIPNVVQLLTDQGVIFCAINAQIAKQIVSEMGFKATVPKPDSKMTTTQVKKTSTAKKPVDQSKSKASISRTMVVVKKDVVQSANIKRAISSKQAATAVLRKAGNDKRPQGGKPDRVPGSSIHKTNSPRITRPVVKSERTATRNRYEPRSEQSRRPAHYDNKRKIDRSADYSSPGSKRRRSSSRSRSPRRDSGSRSRGNDRRVERSSGTKEQHRQIQPRRFTSIARPRLMPRPEPPRPSTRPKLSKPPIPVRPTPRGEYRQRPSIVERRGRPRTPPMPMPPSSSSATSAPRRRQQHQPGGGAQHQPQQNRDVRGQRRGEVSADDLHRLTEVLKSYVGLDYGRELNAQDLDHVRNALPPGTLDDLLELLRRVPNMSFHNFFAQRGATNPALPPGALVMGDVQHWTTMAAMGGAGAGNFVPFDNPMANRSDVDERPSIRRSSFGAHNSSNQGRGRSSKDNGDQYSHGHRHESRKDRSSDVGGGPRRRVTLRANPGDLGSFSATTTQSGSNFGAMPTFDVVQSFESPSTAAAMGRNGKAVYAQPLSYMDPTFMVQQAAGSSGMASGFGHPPFGIPMQASNASVFMPQPPQEGNVGEFWNAARGSTTHRRGDHHHQQQGGGRKW